MNPPKVYLIDDDEEVLATYAFIVKRHSMEPVCIGDPALALSEEFPMNNGCIVLDLNMPQISGMDLLKKFREQNNTLPVIIATGHVDVSLAVECMEQGAFTLLEKPIKSAVLLDKIRRAISHINMMANTLKRKIDTVARLEALSKREQEVARLLADGLKASHIAEKLYISSRTVETHRENLLRKLDLTSSSQISGLLTLAEL